MQFIITTVTFILYYSLPNLVCGGTWTPALANWNIADGNDTCILMVGYFTFLVPYQLLDGQSSEAVVPIPKDAFTQGTCTDGTQEIALEWDNIVNPVGITGNDNATTVPPNNTRNRVTFTFEQHGVNTALVVTGYFELTSIKAEIRSDPAQFPDAAQPDKLYELHASGLNTWSAPLDMSYFCRSPDSIPLNIGSLETGGIHVQAFHNGPIGLNNMDFGPRSYCAGDVDRTILTGFLYIGLLFIISLGIAIFISRKRRIRYEIL